LLRRKGKSVEQIAADCDRSVSSVHNALDENGARERHKAKCKARRDSLRRLEERDAVQAMS
jgi:DNA-binding NarL/FixJ family response regulator